MIEMRIAYLQGMLIIFEENEDVEELKAGKSVAYCEAYDRDLKRAAPGLSFSEKTSIGISPAIYSCNKSCIE